MSNKRNRHLPLKSKTPATKFVRQYNISRFNTDEYNEKLSKAIKDDISIQCIFCDESFKINDTSVTGYGVALKDGHGIDDQLKVPALRLKDTEFLRKIDNVIEQPGDFFGVHEDCKDKYWAKQVPAPAPRDNSATLEPRDAAKAELYKYIEENILKRNNMYLLDCLHFCYCKNLQMFSEKQCKPCDKSLTPDELLRIVKKKYKDDIRVVVKQNKKIVVPGHCEIVDKLPFEYFKFTDFFYQQEIYYDILAKSIDRLFLDDFAVLEKSNRYKRFVTRLMSTHCKCNDEEKLTHRCQADARFAAYFKIVHAPDDDDRCEKAAKPGGILDQLMLETSLSFIAFQNSNVGLRRFDGSSYLASLFASEE